ncbi:13861_t:CDS:1, partial [Cetraspora pellucida]
EELKAAQKNLLATIKEIKKDGGEVVFEDKIDELKKRCEEYEKKAQADGQKADKYNAYINRLLEKAVEKNRKLTAIHKYKEERGATERERLK